MIRTKLLAATLVAGLTAVSCGGSVQPTGPGTEQPPIVRIPTKLLGMDVKAEDVRKDIEAVDRSYFDSVGLFSFREGDLLRATLQVARFNSAAREDSNNFRRAIVGLLGTSTPQEMRVAENIVYSTSGTEQIVYAWFNKKGMFVLSVHREYEFPRTLLRRSLAIEL